MNIIFPFPDREHSMTLLEQDPEYLKIPADEIPAVFDRAWQSGVDAALALLKDQPQPLDFSQIARDSGLKILHKPEDNVAGGMRFYSDFYPRVKEIYLYEGSIKLWCEANDLTLDNGRMLILSHEYFHFLESTALGWTSKQYPVYMLKLGNLTLGKTGVPALSEIGANAFSYTCFPYLCMDVHVPVPAGEEKKEAPAVQKRTLFGNQRKEKKREIFDQFFKF